MFDLSKNNPAVVAETGYEFDVVMPDGTVTDIKIKVRGINSPVVKTYSRKIINEMKIKEQAAKRRGRDVEEMSIEEMEEQYSKAAAVRIIDWSNLADEGKEVKFSKEEAEVLMLKYPFIREQVMEESDNILNFRHG